MGDGGGLLGLLLGLSDGCSGSLGLLESRLGGGLLDDCGLDLLCGYAGLRCACWFILVEKQQDRPKDRHEPLRLLLLLSTLDIFARCDQKIIVVEK
jgi:hypothetical protein